MTDSESEPLSCGKDVAVALGYSNARDAVKRHVELEDVVTRDTPTMFKRRDRVVRRPAAF